MQTRFFKSNSQSFKTVLFFLPAVLLLLFFFTGPMLLSIMFSFTNFSLTGSAAKAMQFVGFRNFVQIFGDPSLARAAVNTVVFLLFSGIIGQQVLGFTMAFMMKKKNRNLRRFVGFTIVTGWVTPEVVAAFMFTAFFADSGTLNAILGLFGKSPVAWLFNFPMVSVIIANIWKGSAYSMMMFQASLDSIPEEVEESAKIDGANFRQMLARITLPMIKGTLAITFIMVTLGTIGMFGLIFMMTGGGPIGATTTLSVLMYEQAFVTYQLGYGTAIALLMLIVGVTLSLLYMKIIKAND